MGKKVRLSESELISVIKKVLQEQFYEKQYYDPTRLYYRDAIINRLQKGPRHLKKYINQLPSIPCTNPETQKEEMCTRIPEVLFVYLFGNY